MYRDNLSLVNCIRTYLFGSFSCGIVNSPLSSRLQNAVLSNCRLFPSTIVVDDDRIANVVNVSSAVTFDFVDKTFSSTVVEFMFSISVKSIKHASPDFFVGSALVGEFIVVLASFDSSSYVMKLMVN